MNNALLLDEMNFIPKPSVLPYDDPHADESSWPAWISNVAWIAHNTARRVDAAGISLLNPLAETRDTELSIISNWRSAHSYPLQVIKMTLSNRAKKVQPDAIIAQTD